MAIINNGFHLIFGAGPAACWTAQVLCQRGLQVKAVNRSGLRPALMPADVQMLAADVMDLRQAKTAAKDASVVYQALNPPYSQWVQLFPTLQAHTVEAAMDAGARYVALENLYMLDAGCTMTESSPVAPRSLKGQVRLSMHESLMRRHTQRDLQVAVVRASDFYGPGVTVSAMAERVFGNIVRHKKAQILIRGDLPHSFAYIKDVGQALAAVGSSADPHVWGNTWLTPHAPAPTQSDMIAVASQQLGRPVPVMLTPPWILRTVGLFIPDAKASIEMLYQFSEAFIVDATRSQDQLKLKPTPLPEGVRATLEWYSENLPS